MYVVRGDGRVTRFLENARARAASPIGIAETQIATEFNESLYDVIEWPIHKKMVHVHHLQAYEAEKEKMMDDQEDVPDVDDMDVAQPPSSGGMTPPSAGQGGGRKPFAGRDDVHPSLRQYDNLVNVQNPGESMGDDRKNEIIENTIQKHGEHNPPARDPGDEPVTSERNSGPIKQASDDE